MTQTHSHKSTNGHKKHLPPAQAELLAKVIGDLIDAHIEHANNPGVGREVIDERHRLLAESLQDMI